MNNEYATLQQFVEEYDGESHPGRASYIGIEFTYHGLYYRVCREPLPLHALPVLPNGQKGHYRTMCVHWENGWFGNFSYEVLGWYANIDDLLENFYIDGTPFSKVIISNETEVVGKD